MAAPGSPSSNGSAATPPAADASLPSAAPPTGARVLAVASIVVAGICGGLIGFSIVDLSQDEGAGSLGPALGGLIGAVAAAVGVAVVAVLVLRAMTEWTTIEQRARAEGREPPRHRRGPS